MGQNETTRRVGYFQVAIPQRLRRTLRQVWNRSQWEKVVMRQYRLLLSRVGKEGKTASTSQSEDDS